MTLLRTAEHAEEEEGGRRDSRKGISFRTIRPLVVAGLLAVSAVMPLAVPALGSSNTWNPTGSMSTARATHSGAGVIQLSASDESYPIKTPDNQHLAFWSSVAGSG